MKYIRFLIMLLLSMACTEQKSTPSEQITAYYEGFKNSDYKQMKKSLSDSLISVEGDYRMAYSRESFYEKFKWDSVFKPIYTLVAIETQDDQAVATVTINSPKLAFLKNNPMSCRYSFHFKSGKIAKIENLECRDANWQLWQKEVDALVTWVQLNHPELDGFINDLSMKGAQHYMQAIAAYTAEKRDPSLELP